MNTNLSLAILFAALLFVTFRLFARYGVDPLRAIVVNYCVAAAAAWVLGFLQGHRPPPETMLLPGPWLTGALFVSAFYLISLATQRHGLALTTAAAKLSVVIPVLAGLVLYRERPAPLQAAGIATAFAAVWLMVGTVRLSGATGHTAAWLPIAVFAGSGLADTSVKLTQQYYLNDENRYFVTGMVFLAAALCGMPFLVRNIVRRKAFPLRDLMWGGVLGIFNLFSLFFLFQGLRQPGAASAVVFSVLNAGVIVLCLAAARWFFRETLTRRHLLGIALSVFAIAMMAA